MFKLLLSMMLVFGSNALCAQTWHKPGGEAKPAAQKVPKVAYIVATDAIEVATRHRHAKQSEAHYLEMTNNPQADPEGVQIETSRKSMAQDRAALKDKGTRRVWNFHRGQRTLVSYTLAQVGQPCNPSVAWVKEGEDNYMAFGPSFNAFEVTRCVPK